MAKRIVIMAGGTGGHVFPALAVAELLIEKGWQVSWLGTQRGLESRVIPEQGIEIDWLSVAGVRGKGIVSKITAGVMLIKACFQANKILRERKPNVVIGMGGFVAGPGGLMAKLLGIPLIIHEQNRIPGTTNRLLTYLANQTLEAFPLSFKKTVNAKCTGNPLRKEFLAATTLSHQQSLDKIRLLIVGGSQGAKILNEIVPEAVMKLQETTLATPTIEIRHQTGEAMLQKVENGYKNLGIKAETSAFIDDMVAAYLWADLIICRAGAMTISEVAAIGVPAILIPLPSAIDDHQTANAHYLTDAGAGLLLRQNDLNAETLAKFITEALTNLENMRAAAKQCASLDATATVANFCVSEARP
jgi:UDP-N-acetylglucosamine--N-acetylmuramyl-(pentapeptide) pyrophosphoryl-undecaprenol N-acetylglucosamine transferase